MDICELIDSNRISCNAHEKSKKRALEHVSKLLASSTPNLTSEEIFSSLIERERLGSTGVGHGVALPHGRLHGREQAVAAFIKLEQAVDYDSIDNEPVDLLYALLVPDHFTDEHLKIISQLASLFNDADFRQQLRCCENPEQIYQHFSNIPVSVRTQSTGT
ncbi:PTS IIA-like nitrogen-regulatory protein PtsN [hydrothermal vent metagenome]|uniref:PTS IIA-like nitrogen-regulatory protein PtsN n=1 Tax=hydrothermal vent metagenome TaxID=652676 RepID=A0A3B0Y9A9_9ZZZZ